MRRPPSWLQWLLLLCLVLLIGQVGALLWLAPRYVMRVVEHALGGELAVGGARLSFPLTTTLTRLHLINNTEAAAFSVQRAVVKPRAFSWTSRTLRFGAVEIERPFWRVTRLKDGTVLWPNVRPDASGSADPAPGAPVEPRLFPARSAWRINVDTIKVVDGVLELFDERPSQSFHGMLDHISFVAGPVTMDFRDEVVTALSTQPATSPIVQTTALSFAGRTQLVGEGGAAASLYCSGWVDAAAKDLQASCRLEPIALAAFESYYHPSDFRISTATLSSTSQWWARSNDFAGRIQLELSNLSEGDLTIRGRTIIDARKTPDAKELRLSGEIHLTGPLNDPHEWHAEFLPGDDQVQQLIKRLLDRGVEMIRIPFPGGPLHVSIAPASRATMTAMEAASREVQEALEILATPPSIERVERPTVPPSQDEEGGALDEPPEEMSSGVSSPQTPNLPVVQNQSPANASLNHSTSKQLVTPSVVGQEGPTDEESR